MNKGQVAMEFVMMLGMAMIITVAFLGILNPMVSMKNEELRHELFEELGRSVQQELLLASVAEDGYGRTFYVPPPELNQSYDRYNYALQNNNTYLKIVRDVETHTFSIPNVTGQVRIGPNTVQKRGGQVYVN